MQVVSVGVLAATKINKGGNSTDSNGHIHQTFAPCPAKRIRNNDTASEKTCEIASRAVRILRKQRDSLQPIDIGLIDARIRTNETVTRFGYQDFTTQTYDPPRFAKNELDEPRIFRHSSPNRPALRRRLNTREVNDPALRLGNNLLCYCQNVRIVQFQPRRTYSIG